MKKKTNQNKSSERKNFTRKTSKRNNITQKNSKVNNLNDINFFQKKNNIVKETSFDNKLTRQNSVITNEKKNKKNNNENIYAIKKNPKKERICLICGDIIKFADIKKNKINCEHLFCSDCMFEYLKEKINNNQFLDILCPKEGCKKIIDSNLIVKFLYKDEELLKKYNKLVKRNQLLLDPKIQLCPYPDCESYAKKRNNKYVKCIHKGHQFCFNCLKGWHGKSPCENNSLSNSLNELENSDRIKRCPKCKFYIELRDGCNHMTCSNCKHQFCWLCLGDYSYDHFSSGICRGLQYGKHKRTCCKIIFEVYLLGLLLIILKSLAFGIIAPYVLIYYIYYKVYYNCIRSREDIWTILYCVAGNLACLTFVVALSVISNLIAILMIFIWPLHNLIFDKIFQ